MKKRPFILMELLLCIALLSLCAIPLLGYPYSSYKRQKALLLEIEKQRQAEILFYELLKNINHQCKWGGMSRKYSDRQDSQTIILNSEGFGDISFTTHCHLYHCHPDTHDSAKNKDIRKIWCVFCFEETKAQCSYKGEKDHPYKFVFYAKRTI